MLFPERDVACPRCGSWNTKNRGSWDKCYDCGKRWGVLDEESAVEELQPPEIPTLKSSSASSTQAMKFARLVMKDRADGMTWDEVRAKHGINKEQSVQVRQIMKTLTDVSGQPGEQPEVPKLAEPNGSTKSPTQAMKHARELKEARVALFSAGLPQNHSGHAIFKELYAQIVEQVPSVSWMSDKPPIYCPACHCHGPGWDVIESPSGRTYDLLACNSCGVVLSHEAVQS